MKIYSTIASSLILSLALTQVSFADHHRADESTNTHKHWQLTEKLNLSDEQKAKIKEMRNLMHADMHAIYEQNMKLNDSINKLTKNTTMDEKKLEVLLKQKAELTAKMLKNKIMFKHKMYNMLDKNQKAKLDEMQNMRQQRMQNRKMQ